MLKQLRQALAKAVGELNELVNDEEAFAAKEAEIANIQASIARAEKATAAAAGLARPVDGIDQSQGRAVASVARVRFGKLRAFNNPSRTVAENEERAFRAGQFFLAAIFGKTSAAEWCRENGIELKAQAEGVDGVGGFLVPEEMMAEIIDLRETFGVFRQASRPIPMGRDTLNWPRRTGGLQAFFMNEGQAATESTAGWDNVNLTAKKIGALAKYSTELDEDAVIDIGDWLTYEIAYAFASKEDDCGFNGDGTSTYGGIRGTTVLAIDGQHNASKYTAAAGHNTFALLDTTDITGLMGLLPQYALPNAAFYCSQVAFATCFERLIANAGGNSIATLDGKISYRYLGFPIIISQKLPLQTTSLSGKVMMHYGDLSLASALGTRRGVTIKRSDQRYFESDQIGILGTERFDINNHDLGDNTTAGPLVSLVAP